MVYGWCFSSSFSSSTTTIDIGSREFVFISRNLNRPFFLLPPEEVLAFGKEREEEEEGYGGDDDGVYVEALVARQQRVTLCGLVGILFILHWVDEENSE